MCIFIFINIFYWTSVWIEKVRIFNSFIAFGGSISKRFFVFVFSGQLPYNLLASQSIFTFAIPLMFRPVNTSCVCVCVCFFPGGMSKLHPGAFGGWRPVIYLWDQCFHTCLHQPHGKSSSWASTEFNTRKPKHSVKAILLHVFLFSKELFFKLKKKSFFQIE